MRTALLWIALVLTGLTLGIGSAILSLRTSNLGNEVRIGPWTTGRDIGTADADIRTRAIVALRGLLALPASEARYFTATTDSAGQPLVGQCRYAVSGGAVAARWWSITVYDREGWLIPNRWQRHALGSTAMGQTADGRWSFIIAPTPAGSPWLPSGHVGPFELTMRLYRPSGQWETGSAVSALPTINRLECAT